MNSEKLLVKNLNFIINHNPKRLTSTIPPVIPLKIGDELNLHLQNRSRYRLAVHIQIKVRNKTRKPVQCLLHFLIQVPPSLLKVSLVNLIQRYIVQSYSVHYIIPQVSVARHLVRCVREFTNPGIIAELLQGMRIGPQSFVYDFAPI